MTRLRLTALSLITALGLVGGPAQAAGVRPATHGVRADEAADERRALSLLRSLNERLLKSPSATDVLQQWCAEHKLAEPARIIARKQSWAGADPEAPASVRLRLEAHASEELKLRTVALYCGEILLSAAKLWYAPDRLTPAMNAELSETETPFGRVVKPLGPSRKTLSVGWYWTPPIRPHADDPAADRPIDPRVLAKLPPYVFAHEVVVLDRNHRPIAVVSEAYTQQSLWFPGPSSQRK